MDTVTFNNKTFKIAIPASEINLAVEKIANQMNIELNGKDPVFISLLNGAFVFTADLLRKLNFYCALTFVKLSSYEGMRSTGEVKEILGLGEPIENRTVVIIDDVVDTGATIHHFKNKLIILNPKEIKVAAMFYKPGPYKYDVKIDYRGLQVGDEFVVGYGLDYDGYGRNLKDLYSLKIKN